MEIDESVSPDLLAADHQQFESAYGGFLSPTFDPLQYAKKIVDETKDKQTDTDSDEISKLMGRLAKKAEALDTLMKQTIVESHSDLLKQVIGVKALDVSLSGVEDQVREIKTYMHGLRTKIHVPYEQSLTYTNQSSNLQLAIKHVQSTAKFIQLVRRLKTQIPEDYLRGGDAKPDFALAALTLLDIERTVVGSDLLGIRVVDHGLETIVNERRALTIREAQNMLETGMRSRGQAEIAGGLQILFNLNTLATTIVDRVNKYIEDWTQLVSGQLDPKEINAFVREHNAKATNIDGSDMIGITGVVWTRLESLVDGLLARGLELCVLDRVLARKRDVLPRFDVSVGALDIGGEAKKVGMSFLDLVVGQLDNSVLGYWWGRAVAVLSDEINMACEESMVVRQMLTNSYPRLVQLFMPRLQLLSNSCVSVTSTQPQFGQTPMLIEDYSTVVLWDKLLSRFETDYVAKAASRMEEAVSRCYPPPPPPGLLTAQESWSSQRNRSGSSASRDSATELMTAVSVVPNRKLVAGVVRSISTELEMVKSDPRLCALVADAAASAINVFANVTEGKIATITVNPRVLNPFAVPAHPLTKSYVGLLNSVESLRLGVSELNDREFAGLQGSGGRRASRRASAHSSRTGSIAHNFAFARQALDDSSLNTGSLSVVYKKLDSSLQQLDAVVSKHTHVLLGAADRAIAEAITSKQNSLDQFDVAVQWLQTQVLEPIAIEQCCSRVLQMVEKYLRVYVSTVCTTFPLTEQAKLQLTGQVTQFEFACSQLVAAVLGQSATLMEIGRPYQALRLMRPLLFMSTAELTTQMAESLGSNGDWDALRATDLAAHVACRIATAADQPLKLPPAQNLEASAPAVRECLESLVDKLTDADLVLLAQTTIVSLQ
ncbi:hypothetical protein GGI25_005765 [Coemansia spiralis]|uniref:Conserved oligomeric Golgi complex subunit 5 n=2 Tax=Coemansia TaxID=4863 RepID=A0A9W8KVX8_9FUNG|nr:Golgi transport complex subunit 5-domain-containing protein [Coemansia spiralis]KAJ1988563.1 hypothetical protein EDC05_005226 [Coemansia umbellata]KAJ2619907.1 hypothetical protein GGI26_005442 [Coemansia sp. RSA 1358]KAJ2670630.1 hypothetical protein GGI25_005765 [Coemansia spiralis]